MKHGKSSQVIVSVPEDPVLKNEALLAQFEPQPESQQHLSASASPGNLLPTKTTTTEMETETPTGELPVEVSQAITEVKHAYRQFKHSAWTLVLAVGKLKAECEEHGLQYLTVVSDHLRELLNEGLSDTTISNMAAAAEYVTAKEITVPVDSVSFPTYSQVVPLKRFISKDKRAKKLKKQWDILHKKVFAADPVEQPSAREIAKEVSGLFAPPKQKNNAPPVPTGLEPEEVTAESASEWITKNDAGGKVIVHRVRVAKLSADVLAAAIKANWASLKDVRFLKIEVLA